MARRSAAWGNSAGRGAGRRPPRPSRIHIHRRNGISDRAAWPPRADCPATTSGGRAPSRSWRLLNRFRAARAETHAKAADDFPRAHPNPTRESTQANLQPGYRRAVSLSQGADAIVAAMRIAIGQINCTVGDLSGNARKILEFADRARAQGADLLLTPELSLCGYPPEDLLLREDFRAACDRALAEIASRIKGISIVVGHPHQVGGKLYNAASVLQNGGIAAVYHKRDLPNYTVFDEERYFESDGSPCVVDINGVRIGVNICEDVWGPDGESTARATPGADGVNVGINICADVWEPEAPKRARAAGAQVLLVLNASPFHINKLRTRYEVVRDRTAETGMAGGFFNLGRGQDELGFDGPSFVMDRRGRAAPQFPALEEVLAVVEGGKDGPLPGKI